MSNTQSNSRRCLIRRQQERRANPFAFNSPEWVAMMRQQFLLWPKEERRRLDRRDADRRSLERRAAMRSTARAKKLRLPHLHTIGSILDEEERQMIMDLFREN